MRLLRRVVTQGNVLREHVRKAGPDNVGTAAGGGPCVWPLRVACVVLRRAAEGILQVLQPPRVQVDGRTGADDAVVFPIGGEVGTCKQT